MKFRSTWGVLLVVVILAAAVWWFELRDTKAPTGRENHLLPFAADSLERIDIEHSGTRYVLSHRKRGWVLLNPVEAPCDPVVIDRLFTVLEEAQIEQNVGSGDDVRYGLGTPTSTMTVTHENGQSSTLQFGRINPLQTLVYVKRQDSNDVLLTTSELLTLSLNTDFGWRDKRVVDVPPSEVHRIRLRTLVAGELTVERGDDDLWYTQGDIAWRVDPVRMQNLLIMLSQMQAVGVSAEAKTNLENYGLNTRRMSAYLDNARGEVIGDIVVGWVKGETAHYVIVPDKPEIFRVGGDIGEVLSAFVADCRDRKVFPPFDLQEVTRIEVDSSSDAFAVERKSVTRWGVVFSSHHDTTFAVNPTLVQETLETLRAMAVDEFPKKQPPRSNFEPAEMTIRLVGADGFLSGVQVGRKDPNGFLTFVRGIDEPAVFLVSPGQLVQLPFDLGRLGQEAVEVLDSED